MVLVALTFLLCGAGCKTKPSGEPAPAPPDVAQADLKAFLDGMLVTTNTPARYEVIWPLDEDASQLDRVLDDLDAGFKIKSADELRKALDVPAEEMNRYQGYLLVRLLWDYPTGLQVWKRFLKSDPDDLQAALWASTFELQRNGAHAALADLASSSGKTARTKSPADDRSKRGYLEDVRCNFLLLDKRPAEALAACNLAAELNDGAPPVATATALMALGRNKEALTQAEQVYQSPAGAHNAGAAFFLGVAQQANGLDAEARTTWSVGQMTWPRDRRFGEALTGPKKTALGWLERAFTIRNPAIAEELALCGHLYSDLGMEARAKECYRQSERLHPGPALAHQLVFLARTKPEQALAEAIKAANATGEPNLLSAVGWLQLRQKHNLEARDWIQRALDAEPDDAKAMSLMWQVCGKLDDFPCVIEYRKRLGLPTHLNVQQYRDATKAWQDQARKNGEGLATRDLASSSVPRPPPIAEIVLIPLGPRVPPELAGLAQALSGGLPGLRIRVGQREDLPPGAYQPQRRQVMWEDLLERLRHEPGRIYLMEQDLGLYDSHFAFAQVDFTDGRAAISLNRLRSIAGTSTRAVELDGAALTAASHRLQGLTLAVVAKLLGVGFPCSNSSCAMHERRAATDLALNDPAFCDAHQKELVAAIARNSAAK